MITSAVPASASGILEALYLVIAAWVAKLRGLGLRLGALLFDYTIGFMIIGRPENAYWGLVTAPLTALGLCFAPAALRDLFRRALA
jgi:hypothetical protein